MLGISPVAGFGNFLPPNMVNFNQYQHIDQINEEWKRKRTEEADLKQQSGKWSKKDLYGKARSEYNLK